MKITNKRRFPVMEGLAVLIIMLIMAVFYLSSRPVEQTGTKTIHVEVVYENQEKEEYTAATDGTYLKDALDEIPGLELSGTTTDEFGLMILSVNGVRADYQKDGAYWAILSNGEPCNYGVSKQPVADGESYSIVYTPAQ